MERGPFALFGAIVAVGLGPALWLGAQFGTVAVPPTQPTTVVLEQTQGARGKTASASEHPPVEIRTTQRSQIKRVSATPSATPSASVSPTPTPRKEHSTTEPIERTEPPPMTEPAQSEEPPSPPTEDTTEPTVPSSGDVETGDPDEQPPTPPPTGDEESATTSAA
jgi:hypothetical protein